MTFPALALTSTATLFVGDALSVLTSLPAASVDAVVTDPPYAIRRLSSTVFRRPAPGQPNCDDVTCTPGNACVACVRADLITKYADAPMLGQQSQNWHASETHSRGYADNDPRQFEAWCDLWLSECLRVLKPGGHLVAFGGTRTWHRLAAAAENAGFEIRDSLAWLYSSGMPKSHNVERALAQMDAAAENRPAPGPWAGWGTALKPAFEPIVLARRPLDGTMAANITAWGVGPLNVTPSFETESIAGRQGLKWPSNVHMDSQQADLLGALKGQRPSDYFWVSKPTKDERVTVDGVAHPTVKPLDLMRRLVRLVTPVDGLVLDPFAGSGTTIEACLLEGHRVIGIERERSYVPLVRARVQRCTTKALASTPARDEDTLF